MLPDKPTQYFPFQALNITSKNLTSNSNQLYMGQSRMSKGWKKKHAELLSSTCFVIQVLGNGLVI